MDTSLILHKHKYKIAIGLFILYLCFSFYRLGEISLWYDECFSLDLSKVSIKEIIHYSKYEDTNPPLYLIIIHYWVKLFGNSELALRSVSAISGSLAFGIFFLFALRFFNWQTAIFAILLYITSNELYYYSQEGRTYGLILLFSVLSNFAFLSLIEKPNFLNALCLGLFNITVFYLHTLGCINIIGQTLLIPFLAFNKHLLSNKSKDVKSFLGFKLKFIICYIFSWLVFTVIFWPWKERFFGIITEGTKGFWLQKPTFTEYKQVLFDFYNGEYLFYIYTGIILFCALILILIKRTRNINFNYKLLLIPFILGPVLYNFDYFAASITPIFLKRYILFTFLSFILLFAYLISCLKIDFRIKLSGILILCFFSAMNVKFPREAYWDYKNGVKYVADRLTSTSYITTDNPGLVSYYIDRNNAFKYFNLEREKVLAEKNIFVPKDLNWPNTVDFSKYKDIYFIRSFDGYADPEKKVENALKQKFKLVEEPYFIGMYISHFSNPAFDTVALITPEDIKRAIDLIKGDKTWYDQIIVKAKKRNVSIDSMLTVDAIWYYKNKRQ